MKLLTITLTLLSMLSFNNSYTIDQGNIYDNNKNKFNLSGISWFGFETQDFVINGLWSHDMDFYLNKIKNNGFNTIRVPFSAEWIIYNYNLYPNEGLIAADELCKNKKSIEILDILFEKTFKLGLKIMLDLHRLHKEFISELWYSPTDDMFPSSNFFKTWFTILDRYQNYPNLIALDLLNEPHGRATWGSGNPSTDWNSFAELAIENIQNRYPSNKWLYLVEGIGWGKDLSNVENHPINVAKNIQNRLVYSAHCYGRSVVSNLDIYNNQQLKRDWDSSFGYLTDYGYTIMIGEYGGITDVDAVWMKTFSNYLINKNIRNNYFWSLGPNSGDVHGLLLDDWTTLDQFKINITHVIQPFPTYN